MLRTAAREAQNHGTSIDQPACVGSSIHSTCSELSLPLVCLVHACTFGLATKQSAAGGGASFCDAFDAGLSFASRDGLRNSGPMWLS